ncbi:MAG TPA: cupin domain-containing protein [Burkholderiaceae bacterium]|nr:cupin domain-containing protein [Burkholderiaceae bacterium]
MLSAYRPQSEYLTGERCHIIEIHNRPEDEDCSIARARVAPGVTTALHSLSGVIERYVILAGTGSVEIAGGPPLAVTALDVVTIAAGASQRITNTGSADLVFLCVCTPRFRPERYRIEEEEEPLN